MIVKLNGLDVEIDDNIASEISQLNKKGYKTTYCCGGHPDRNNGLVIYVTFDKHYDFPILPSGFNYTKKNVVEFINENVTIDVYERMFYNFQLWVKSLPRNKK